METNGEKNCTKLMFSIWYQNENEGNGEITESEKLVEGAKRQNLGTSGFE